MLNCSALLYSVLKDQWLRNASVIFMESRQATSQFNNHPNVTFKAVKMQGIYMVFKFFSEFKTGIKLRSKFLKTMAAVP